MDVQDPGNELLPNTQFSDAEFLEIRFLEEKKHREVDFMLFQDRQVIQKIDSREEKVEIVVLVYFRQAGRGTSATSVS